MYPHKTTELLIAGAAIAIVIIGIAYAYAYYPLGIIN